MIWYTEPSLHDLHERQANTFGDFMGIVFTHVDPDGLRATLTLKRHHLQPAGIMHGGISCVFAETIGSTAANYCIDRERFYCVGLELNTNHIGQAKEGPIVGKATPFHIGKSTQVWHIAIHDHAERLISINRLTMATLKRR